MLNTAVSRILCSKKCRTNKTRCRVNPGYRCCCCCATTNRSRSSACSSYSMEVGPPPTTTNDSSRDRSASEMKGLAARSKHSSRRLRMLRASPSCFRKNTWFSLEHNQPATARKTNTQHTTSEGWRGRERAKNYAGSSELKKELLQGRGAMIEKRNDVRLSAKSPAKEVTKTFFISQP